MVLFSFDSIQASGSLPGVENGTNEIQVPLLNWSFKIQRSGLFKEEYSSKGKDNLEVGPTQVVIYYKRTDSPEVVENCQESLEINGVIKVKVHSTYVPRV